MNIVNGLLNGKATSFLQEAVGEGYRVIQVAGDASFRRYYRVTPPNGESLIFMDAPPDRENSHPFVDIARFLREHGVRVPELRVVRPEEGHLLLEDFGDTTFLVALSQGVPAEQLYRAAVETLLTIQSTPLDGRCLAHGRPFNRDLLRIELALFTDWYVEGIRRTPITPEDRQQFEEIFQFMLDQILRQPMVFVHRDYHSRNLMWHQEAVGVLDFQDAVIGPATYDLASLLRDCYVAWGPEFREWTMRLWLEGAQQRFGYAPEWNAFVRDFDWMALQRNLKAIGIFGRLSLRDGKHGYLNDIPRTLGYVRESLARYPELEPLRRLVERYAPLEADGV